MEGRETGSEGLRKAQEYVVQQLTRAGLEPGTMVITTGKVHFPTNPSKGIRRMRARPEWRGGTTYPR